MFCFLPFVSRRGRLLLLWWSSLRRIKGVEWSRQRRHPWSMHPTSRWLVARMLPRAMESSPQLLTMIILGWKDIGWYRRDVVGWTQRWERTCSIYWPKISIEKSITRWHSCSRHFFTKRVCCDSRISRFCAFYWCGVCTIVLNVGKFVRCTLPEIHFYN